jgi:hypothetical protein
MRNFTYKDDAFEVVRLNVAVAILVEVTEGLTQTFTLKTLHNLSELVVCKPAVSQSLKPQHQTVTYIPAHVCRPSCPGRAGSNHCKMLVNH